MVAASSSSDDSQIKHDVFINFAGNDTRREEKKYHPRSSEQFKNRKFQSSYSQKTMPLQDPSHVRHQKGAYENAFADHELKFQGNGLKVQNWRSALKNAADLSGYVASIYYDDAELIDEIVKDVLLRLNHVYPSEPKGLVGIDQHIDPIRSFLEMESKEVQILGIWGMSGIGKTTVAQVAYDKFSPHFEGSYFLDNVREESQNHGLTSLKQRLISELQEEKCASVKKRLLSRRKVFVVLDDVDTPEQLHHLVTERIRLGPGSRVIVTSKNKQALVAGGVHAIHEVKGLDFEESLKLFSLNAFKNSHPEKGYEDLSKKAVAYAKGLPLALKVLGLCLYSADRETWNDTLRKLEMHPHPRIHDVFKISYHRLDDVERHIFLDIAFFYNGEDKDHVMSLLDANNLFPASGIKVLLDRDLVFISNDNIIQMPDLIQETAREIVHQECKENPGKRSRLKGFEEVYDVLKNNKGTDAIKGIALCASLVRHVQLNVDTFKNMTNLRVVKFYFPCHLPVISKAQKIEWEDICCHESCNVNPHNLSLSMIFSLDRVRSKDSKTLHSEGNFRFLSRSYDVSFSCSVKESPLSSRDISDPDLSASKFKMLCSSMGRLSMRRRIIQGGSRQEILPIHESCCRQMIRQIPNLHTLFGSFLYQQELFMGQHILFKVFRAASYAIMQMYWFGVALFICHIFVHFRIPLSMQTLSHSLVHSDALKWLCVTKASLD
ncbi:hypothetical protein K1719_002278 [Acacia pycnantha]|nr:hypothetical protein K1719_002278 [Acacia pycnantha]